MKIDMDEAYVYRSRIITLQNEVDCTRDVKMYSAEQCVFTVREYWRMIHLKNVKGHFRISMMKEVYRQNPAFTNWWKKLLTQHAEGLKMCDRTLQDVNHMKIKKFLRNGWLGMEPHEL
jgi:hypothetical protein